MGVILLVAYVLGSIIVQFYIGQSVKDNLKFVGILQPQASIWPWNTTQLHQYDGRI